MFANFRNSMGASKSQGDSPTSQSVALGSITVHLCFHFGLLIPDFMYINPSIVAQRPQKRLYSLYRVTNMFSIEWIISFSFLFLAGTLLLLTTSNLLLWEHVSSSPSSRLSTGSLYQRVVELSHYTHDLASKVFTEFVSTGSSLKGQSEHSTNERVTYYESCFKHYICNAEIVNISLKILILKD